MAPYLNDMGIFYTSFSLTVERLKVEHAASLFEFDLERARSTRQTENSYFYAYGGSATFL